MDMNYCMQCGGKLRLREHDLEVSFDICPLLQRFSRLVEPVARCANALRLLLPIFSHGFLLSRCAGSSAQRPPRASHV